MPNTDFRDDERGVVSHAVLRNARVRDDVTRNLRESKSIDRARVHASIRVCDVDKRREGRDRADRREVAGREEERAFAARPGCEFMFESGMFAMRAAEEPRAAAADDVALAQCSEHARVATEAEVVVGREVDCAGRNAAPRDAQQRSIFEDGKLAANAVEIRHVAAARRASSSTSTSVPVKDCSSSSVDESGGTSWIVGPIGRVKWPRS